MASFLALFCHHAAAFVGVTAGGWLSDRLARRCAARGCSSSTWACCWGPVHLVDGPVRLAVLCCVALAGFGLFRGVYDSNLFAAPFDVIEPRYRLSAVGVMLCCAFVMGASASTILAWIAQRLDMATAISSMSGVYVAAGLFVLLALGTTFAATIVPNRSGCRRSVSPD